LPPEELYVDSFSADEVQWIEVGSSPYLHDSDIDYIRCAVNNYYESKFGFPASGGSGTINSVKIRVEAASSAIGIYTEVYVWDGSAWQYLGDTSDSDEWTWTEFDATAILNTWAKINGATLRFKCRRISGSGTVYVRRATRKVDYTPVAAKAGLHPSKIIPLILNNQ